jgi:hypothetical protein
MKMVWAPGAEGMQGFVSANSTIVTGALWGTRGSSSGANTEIGLSLEEIPFAGPVSLRIYIIDAAHNNVPTNKPMQPTSMQNLAAAGQKLSWTGSFQGSGVIYFEIVPVAELGRAGQ